MQELTHFMSEAWRMLTAVSYTHLIGNNLVIHAFVDLGVILSSIDDVLFYDAKGKSRLRAVYRFRKGGK